MLSRRHPLVGLALYSVVFTNGLMHVMASLMLDQSYNPDLLTAVVVFLPLSTWVGCACFGRDRLSYKAMSGKRKRGRGNEGLAAPATIATA
jgi:hypothetical protein